VQITDGLSTTPLLASSSKRLSHNRLITIAATIIVASAVIVFSQTSQTSQKRIELFDYEHDGGHSGGWSGTTDPPDQTDDQVKNIWFDKDHAWKDIDDIFPTEAKPWEDENDPAVGYKFSNAGSVTGDAGYTGYYDTTLRDGTQVFPNEDADTGVNDILGYDPVLNGGNALWGRFGGNTVEKPAAWSHVEPLNVATMSDGDYAPYSWVNGGSSHSSIGAK